MDLQVVQCHSVHLKISMIIGISSFMILVLMFFGLALFVFSSVLTNPEIDYENFDKEKSDEQSKVRSTSWTRKL